MSAKNSSYGGPWTEVKLEVVEKYLDAYTTALKKQPFELWYVDPFAGTGEGRGQDYDPEMKEYIKGSSIRALEIKGKPFDKFFFIDNNKKNLERLLSRLKSISGLVSESDLESARDLVSARDLASARDLPGRIRCAYGDANEAISKLCSNIQSDASIRAVVFLDPFAMSVEFKTIESIAKTQRIDLWVLFPYMAVNRLLPRKIKDINELKAKKKLTDLFGDDSWKELYKLTKELFESYDEKACEAFDLVKIYIRRLKAVFENHDVKGEVLKEFLLLKNSNNSIQFALCFAAGNENGASLALKIAKPIVEKKKGKQ